MPGLWSCLDRRNYTVVSGGTDNHLLLIDALKFPDLTGKEAENTAVKADITVNKNMVPYDSRSPFSTSGIRVGSPAVTTRGLKEHDMETIVGLIDEVLSNIDDQSVIERVKTRVKELMGGLPLYAW